MPAAVPAGRIGQAEDIADAVAFLIGSSFVAGQVLICDGASVWARKRQAARTWRPARLIMRF
ncbi:hypothetical protein [Chromobacterium subtsugae]|uniref:hypothetical protein n=1 Tax=Chromobacterium subtsugae TaxID=251747 RepID=UPI0006412EB9|nr:hypothetical protein [Chromobacterium subtsugae]